MPVEIGVWRIEGELQPVEFAPLELEQQLEDILAKNIQIASPNWMVIGRQVLTDYGHKIDLLAIDRDANLVVLELKRDKTPRDVLAQLLDYGSWVRDLENDRIAQIFDEHQKKLCPTGPVDSIDTAFSQRFGIPLPDEMNTAHELVVVASQMDPSTERIVRYLSDEYDVRVNAVFFRAFRDDGREYLTRAWFLDPAELSAGITNEGLKGDWNGEYYASFGYDRDVVIDGLERGYLAAGGGSWYTNTLKMLQPGNRVWVNLPGAGYIAVGTVLEPMVPVDDFLVTDESGASAVIQQVSSAAQSLNRADADPETADYLVRMKWHKTVSPLHPVKEKGFFGNQNSVARPRSLKWEHTVQRLKSAWGLD